MNILLMSDHFPPDKIGGVWEVVKNLKSSFEADGHNVFVLATGKRREGDKEQNIFRTSDYFLWGILINNFIALRLIYKCRIDVVHFHQAASPFFLGIKVVKKLLRFPKIVATFHGNYVYEPRATKRFSFCGLTFHPTRREYFEKYLLSVVHIILDFVSYLFSDLVTVVSPGLALEFESSYGKFLKKSITLVPNGTNIAHMESEVPQNMKALRANSVGGTSVLYLGQLRSLKGIIPLIFAFKKVASEISDAFLFVVGGGRGYEQLIRGLIRDLGLEDRVSLIGPVPEDIARAYLCECDIFCLPSYREGMPLVLLNAMAAGKAVIASQLPGTEVVVHENLTGFLTPAGDVETIADRIIDLAKNPAKRARLGTEAKRLIRQEFTWSIIAKKYLDIFQQILQVEKTSPR